MPHKRIVLLAVVAGLLAATIACAEEAPKKDVFEVKMQNIAFAPAELHVPIGATVVWINEDTVSHTVTPKDKTQWGSEGSGDATNTWLRQGQKWSFTFTKPGAYEYFCIPHTFMVGKIIVGDAQDPVAP